MPISLDDLESESPTEITEGMLSGHSIRSVAKMLGVSDASVRRSIRTMRMQDLLVIESRRVMRHMMTRDLGKEKYLALATALGGMIEKTRLLREEPTEIVGGQAAVERLAVLLYGPGGGASCQETEQPVIEAAAEGVHEIHGSPEPVAEEGNPGDDGGGEEL